MKKIVALNQLVRKLGKRKPIGTFAAQTGFHGIFSHHIIYGDVLANISYKIKKRKTLHPIVIIYHYSLVFGTGRKIQKLRKLIFHTFLVVAQSSLIQQIPFGTFARRIADHSRSSTHQGNRFVTATLKERQKHNWNQIANVQRICSWVKTHVGSTHGFL